MRCRVPVTLEIVTKTGCGRGSARGRKHSGHELHPTSAVAAWEGLGPTVTLAVEL